MKRESQKKRGKKRIGRKEKREERKEKKEGRKKRNEEKRRSKEFDVDRTIKSESIDSDLMVRSTSNFDITSYSTPETTGWSPIEISMVGFS